MKRIDSDGSIILILERGEELHASLTECAKTTGLKSAWLSGLGGAMRATLGFYDIETKSYAWKDYAEPLEILSLSGNLSLVDDAPFWHIHGVFSRRDSIALGGHIKEMVIGLTGELRITPISTDMRRTLDDETGLKLLG